MNCPYANSANFSQLSVCLLLIEELSTYSETTCRVDLLNLVVLAVLGLWRLSINSEMLTNKLDLIFQVYFLVYKSHFGSCKSLPLRYLFLRQLLIVLLSVADAVGAAATR